MRLAQKYTEETKYMFGVPESEEIVETFEGKGEQHVGVLKISRAR